MTLTNFHAHSTFCDGAETPEAIVAAAIRKGLGAFGISGHSYMGFPTEWCMTPEGETAFIREMDRLKAVYGDRLALFTGIELDCYSPEPSGTYDYVIGAAHYIRKDGELLSVDMSLEQQREDVLRHFGGDYYAYTREYYRAVAGAVPATQPDIVAHFDLVSKFNEGGALFDETDRRYTVPALEALAAVLEKCRLFEINTGSQYRLGRSVPYPSPFFLKVLRDLGGEIILSSDSHDGASLCFKFDEAAQLAKSCGFTYAKTLTKDGFVEYRI